jgi:enamine deaminase RidA (YjgF/YER057c/UK114 family)
LHVGGLSAPAAASLEAQVEATFERLLGLLMESGFGPATLVKITLFHVVDPDAGEPPAERALIFNIARRYLPQPRPVVTLVTVESLPHPGQRFQMDGIAVSSTEPRVELTLPARTTTNTTEGSS